MIRISKTDVYGWEAAIRGMRNPMNSWDKSDSYFETEYYNFRLDSVESVPCTHIGSDDLKLMMSLSKAGNDHGKFLRMINVTMDIIAPLYWWKEFDTYKVGTVANSCSTMHKIHAKEFVLGDFSWEKLDNQSIDVLEVVINRLNYCRNEFLATKDKKWWDQMIQLLPTSYEQKRTVQLNHQVLKSMYHARKNHKLQEWRDFCAWCETLPYFKEICGDEGGESDA